jgi:undecaprenyl phosphate N,N'-diacetylbacillosamine 1-phosphate transferase
MYQFFFKRFFDFSIALILLLVTSPIIIITAIVLFFLNNGSPFFTQVRPGKNEKLFKIIKFKTMTDKKDMAGNLLSDELRMTKIGYIIRKLSIDELPQLLNVLNGDMSLIGPRPLLVQYLPLYNQEQKKRHNIRPGITGWAQVNGRNAISWEQKFNYDIEYVDNISLGFDLKIIFKTIKKVIVSEGISMQGQATTDFFRGNTK